MTRPSTPIAKVLIANRGEIAVRIARACRDYGVPSVAVYADPDAQALHVQAADEAWALNGTRAQDSYLRIDKLLDIARRSGANAVHPGYGFLAERADFAQAVLDAGLIWIGPPPHTIEALGDKVAARKIALQVGAPLVAGTAEPVRSADEVLAFAREHGLPVAIKAAYGGGGRGLKVAWQLEEVAELYHSAVREATAAFGRGECFLEQFLDRPRHIEAQIVADQQGSVVVVGTRDCSLQRRNQKLVEEAPAPFLSPAQTAQIENAARAICQAAGYVGAGTVEFLLSRSGQVSFLEVNTRLQVEHCVTEETSGVDLVLEQLRIADGLPLSITSTPQARGHSFEFRINAEDPDRGYLPTPGTIRRFEAPSAGAVAMEYGITQMVDGQRSGQATGLTYAAADGETVTAPQAGNVVFAGTLTLTGGTVVIDHGCGVKSYLYGLETVGVERGQSVSAGDPLGTAGTAHNLIYELRIGSKSTDPQTALDGNSGLQFREAE